MLLRCAAVACAVACGGAKPDACSAPAGDPSLAIELQAVAVDASGALQPLHDGDALLLQKPPQGGYVVYAGAAARNLMPCAAVETAELIDGATGTPLSNLDQRRTDFTEAGGGFWHTAQPYAQTPNSPACPDALHAGVAGRRATLHVDVLDAQSRRASIDVQVTVSCGADAACACICGPDPAHC